jgi:hypothetical protein
MAALIDRLSVTPASSFTAEAILAHNIPGRLRVVMPALKDKPGQAALIRAQLDRLDGVHATYFNAPSGSLVVEYDSRTHDARNAVIRALDDSGFSLVRPIARTPAPMHDAQLAALKTIFHCVLDFVVEGAIVAVT